MLPVRFRAISFFIARCSTFSGRNWSLNSLLRSSHHESMVHYPSLMFCTFVRHQSLASSMRYIEATVTFMSWVQAVVALKYCSTSKMKFSNSFASRFPLKGLGFGNFSLLDPVLVCPAVTFSTAFMVTLIRVLMTDIFSWMSSIVVLNSSANPLNKLIIVFCSTSNSSPRPSLCATELSGLPDGLGLLVGATLSSSEVTRNISSAIATHPSGCPLHRFLRLFHSIQSPVLPGTSLRNKIFSSIKVSRSACDLGVDFVVDMFSVFAISRSLQSSDTTCYYRTFDRSGLVIVRHSLFNDKWAKPIRSYVAYDQTTYARASGLGFKRRF